MIDYRKLYSKYDKEDLVNTCVNLKQNKERLRKEVNRSYIACDEKDKEIERLNNIIKAKDEGIKALTEDLCEESIKIEKAIEYIEKRKQEREKANKYAYDIRNDDFIKYCNIELDILKGDDK